MKYIVRIPASLIRQTISDLERSHEFASERVGYLIGKSKVIDKSLTLICITEYRTLEDTFYVDDETVGARINSDAIRYGMQMAMDRNVSVFHVHKHFGKGIPSMSSIDKAELPKLAKAFSVANPNIAHGLIILSDNDTYVRLVDANSSKLIVPEKITIIGYPMKLQSINTKTSKYDKTRYDRQSFLGFDAQKIISKTRVGIVGAGGGGSHIVQQLAHLGFLNYVIFDGDTIDKSNLNRLVGGTEKDVTRKENKTDIAKRLIKGIQSKANIELIHDIWQNHADLLHTCDIVIGCVDTFSGRRDLESDCRRYLIPYIDIGMDVRIISPEPPRMYGQSVISMPGEPCLKCQRFLTDDVLAREAAKYGDAGSKPQVIWANGLLASVAVGQLIDLLTKWTADAHYTDYRILDGNSLEIKKNERLQYINEDYCKHFPISQAGAPTFY